MKKIFTYHTLYFLLAALCLTSCASEFDALPGNQITEATLFKTEDGFKAAANGLYTSLQDPYYYGGAMITIPELYTPYSAAGGYDDPTLSRIFDAATKPNFKLEATNPRIRNIWVSIYNTIRACNVFLAQGKAGKPGVVQEDSVWNNLKGQAQAIRALAHFDLLRLYGEHWNPNSEFGIPVMKTVPTVSDKHKRNTVAETYDAIIADLDTTLFQGKNEPNPLVAEGASGGRMYFDATAVKALLARVYLYQKDYNKAKALASEVIETSGISLAKNLSTYYSARNGAEESILELSFSSQNPSALNLTTYKNFTASIRDLVVGVDADVLKTDYLISTGDWNSDSQRKEMFDYRTKKYSSFPVFKNNPAYIIRLSEMYLILAEANNFDLTQLGDLRTARGATGATTTNDEKGMFAEIVAELNFEGAHVMCARARLNIDGYRDNGKGIFPIPQAERIATNKIVAQNPHYPD